MSLTLCPYPDAICFVCHIISIYHCQILPLLCYVHMLVACFVSLTLFPHQSTIYFLCNVMSASSCYVFCMSHNTQISLHFFSLSHISVPVLALSHYTHDAVPYFISLTLCCCLTTMFFLSYFMPPSTIFCPVSNMYYIKNILPKYWIHEFCMFGFLFFKPCLTISPS